MLTEEEKTKIRSEESSRLEIQQELKPEAGAKEMVQESLASVELYFYDISPGDCCSWAIHQVSRRAAQRRRTTYCTREPTDSLVGGVL